MSDSRNHNGDTPAGNGHAARHGLGLAGRTARAFIESPITPLLLLAFFLIGFLGALVTPREEDPQISVPMVDVMVAYPGASSTEVANLVSEPLERLMSELSGVKHVYSMSHDGFSMVTVRFKVGEQMEPSLVKLYDKLQSNMDVIPKGVMPPLVKPKSIDDVPVVTVTLSSDQLDLVQLRKLGLDVQQRFKALPNTGLSFVTGGSFEHIRVEVDPSRLSSYNLTPSMVAQALSAANQRMPAGDVIDGSRYFEIYSGEFLKSAADVANLIITTREDRPIYLRDVANIVQGPSETKTIVESTIRGADGAFTTRPAVTVAVAKKLGTNGVDVAHALLTELDQMKGSLIPESVDVIVSRDYGETARDKVSHLIQKLFIVSALVTVLAYFTMGFRPAVIVLITIPAVLLMSLAVAYVLGFTINRVSMFALVFAIGILVDDAIVVVENVYRRWLADEDTSDEITVDAVDEVGNPTILATFTVIAALLPMGFVSEMMGPYMLPIPVLSSAAMLFSLIAAFVFVPWLAARVKPSMETMRRAAESEHRQSEIIAGWYSRFIVPIMNNRLLGWITLLAIIAMMMAAVALLPFKQVAFKMLPYDNKSELQVVIDMPEGSDLFLTANLATRIGAELQKIHEVTAYQTYVGTSSPFNFNGLVRHYFLRSQPWQGDIAVQLQPKHHRERSSHIVAEDIRAVLHPIARAAGARLTIAEAPPGPPVLAPLVAEVYGPTPEIRREVATEIMQIMEDVPDIADVNSFMEAPHNRLEFKVDRQRAAMFGVTVEAINRELMMVAGGFEAGALQSPHNLEQAVIVLQAPLSVRVNLGNLLVLPIPSDTGRMVPLGELGEFTQVPVNPPIYHKDLRAVEYVTGDVIGPLGAPLYGMLQVDGALKSYVTPDGQVIGGRYFSRPENTDVSGFKWDGEWQVTYVTFRDMGLAFMAALVLIYILVVAEFRDFLLPAVVMAPIPLTLIGIVPGHWLLGADFTATSMIGFIALAGIIVRNSILLVEFARAEVQNGMDVKEAITLAAQVRLRPIVITALALIIGSMVLLSDPIFQGMAVSLLFGSLVATFLTLVVIPLGCISSRKRFEVLAGGPSPSGGPEGGPAPDSPPSGGNGGGDGPAPSGRPAKLARKSETEAETVSADATASPAGRPPKLQRKSDTEEAPAVQAGGRPPKLQRKSETDAAATEAVAPEAPAGRPAKLQRKSDTNATAAAAAAPPAAGRPPKLLKKSEQPVEEALASAAETDAIDAQPAGDPPEATAPEQKPAPTPRKNPAKATKPAARKRSAKTATPAAETPPETGETPQGNPQTDDPLAEVLAAARRAAADTDDREGSD
ncbi:efflux RND transporter permease subunit [Marimonas arenosa]|uniref:Efflux RND transporter permease subunit n=1 Tax=Marimonas arenosa TaxID=1795305 RepID=A0AAE4B707_9RHOB|nr:efflux RND transporter permease subunit [Marimonas arenosa]MDQ2090951.1 efflux RND transporter permease subunit [Marimonas arenosa]